VRAVVAARRVALTAPWSPHAATTVIGLAFGALLLVAGAWTYTDVLQDLARGMAASLNARVALGVAVLLGALVGGWVTGKLKWGGLGAVTLLRCATGGLLMGWGGALIPGGNDNLVLLGMPMLWPYAWVAFVTMVVVIAAALYALEQR
jgi:toxin CptA